MTDLRLDAPVVTVGHSALVRAVVRNFGAAAGRRGPRPPDGRRPARPRAAGRPAGRRGRRRSSSTSSSRTPGRSPGRGPDRRRPADARQPPLAGRPGPRVAQRPARRRPLQVRALPGRDRLPGPGPQPGGRPRRVSLGRSATEVVSESQLSRRELAPYDAVVLCNVAQFTEAEVDRAGRLPEAGRRRGRLRRRPGRGRQLQPLLYADGKGLLPASSGPTVGDAAKKEAAFGFNPLGFRHPIVAEFGGEPDPVTAGLTRSMTWQFHKLKLPQGLAGARSPWPSTTATRRDRGAAAPRHGDPGRHLGRRGLDDLAAAPELSAGHGADRPPGGRGPARRAERPGRPAARPGVPGGRGRGRRHGHHCPTAQPSRPSSRRPAGSASSTSRRPSSPGPYQVKIGPPLALESTFAANPDPAESDPAKLDRAGLAEAVPGWNFAYLTNWRELTGNAASVGRRGELHRPLLYGVLVLLLLESFLAWKFGHHDPLGVRIADRDGLDAPTAGRSTGRRARPGRRGDRPAAPVRAALVAVGSLLLVVLGCAGLIVWLYRREGRRRALQVGPGRAPDRPGPAGGLHALRGRALGRADGAALLRVMVDDSASEQIADQYEHPSQGRAGGVAAAGWRRPRPGADASRRADPAGDRQGLLILKDEARLLRELQKQHKVRLYLVSNAARLLAEIDKPEDSRPAVEKLREVEPTGGQSRLGDGVRQVLTELRGAPPSAIVLLTDGQTTEGEPLAKAAELAARKGVPLYTIGLGEPRARPRPGADRAAGRRRRLRRRPGPVPGQAPGARVRRARRSRSGSRSATRARPTRSRPATWRRSEVDGPARRPARCGSRSATAPRRPARSTYILEVEPRPRELQADNNRIERDGQRPQGEAQGPARRQRAALRVPLPEELPRARGDDRPERRPALVRPRVQRAGPLGPADVPRRQGRAVRLRRRARRRRRPELPEPVADAEPRRVRHREGGRHPVHRGRDVQPALATGGPRWSSSCRSSWPRPATRRPSATRSPRSAPS